MGWGFKPFESLTLPSITAFSTIDLTHPDVIRPTELRDRYDAAAELALPESVPEAARDYFDAVRMLWVYGWYYYPFYAFAIVQSGLCVELALKERYRRDGLTPPRGRGSFARMLQAAVDGGWLVPERFTRIRDAKEMEDSWGEITEESDDEEFSVKPDSNTQSERMHAMMGRLLDSMRKRRNHRAHPDTLSNRLPGMSYAELRFASDLIAQLFESGSAIET